VKHRALNSTPEQEGINFLDKPPFNFLASDRLTEPLVPPIWWASLGHFQVHFLHTVFFLLLPLIKDHFNLTYTQMGGLVTTVQVIGTLANFPSGAAVDMLGRRHVFMGISLAIIGMAYLMVALTKSYLILIGCMTLSGIGIYMWHPATLSMLHIFYPQRRGWAVGWHATGANVGDAVGPLVAGWLLIWFSWRFVFISTVIPTILLGLIIFWTLSFTEKTAAGPEEENTPNKNYRLSIKQYLNGLLGLVRNPHILLLTLATGFRAMTQTALLTFLPSMFINLWSFTPFLAGTGLAVMNLSGTVATPISGKISDRYGRKRVARIGLLFSMIAVILIIYVRVSILLVVVLGILGFFLYSLRPVFIAWAMELAPEGFSGSIVAFTFLGQSLLSALVPLIGGWMADKWSLTATLYLIVFTILAAELLVITVPESVEQKE